MKKQGDAEGLYLAKCHRWLADHIQEKLNRGVARIKNAPHLTKSRS